MIDLIKSIFSTTEERIKNPIIGTFIISFIVFNWKPIFIISFYHQLNILDRILLSEKYSSFWNYLIFPLVSIVVYNVGLPFINLFFHKVKRKPIKEMNQIDIDIEKDKMDYRNLKIGNKNNEVLENENLYLKEEIASIKHEKIDLEKELLNIKDENNNLKRIIDDNRKIEVSSNNSFKRKIVKFNNGPHVLIERNNNGELSYHQLDSDIPITKSMYYMYVSDFGIFNEQIVE